MRRSSLLIISILALIPVVTGVGYVVRFKQAHSAAAISQRLSEQRAAARREGIPLDALDLTDQAPPPGKNAASIYHDLTRILDKKQRTPAESKAMPGGPDWVLVGTPDEIRRIVGARKEELALAHRAADTTRCVYQRDWSSGDDIWDRESGTLRFAIELITMESHLLAVDGKFDQAVSNQQRGFAIARHSAAQYGYAGVLGATHDYLTVLRGMQDILTVAGPRLTVDLEVKKVLLANPPEYSVKHALQGDVVSMEYGLKELRRDGPNSLDEHDDPSKHPPLPAGEARKFNGEVDTVEAEYLSRMRTIFASADKQTWQNRDATDVDFGLKVTGSETDAQVLTSSLLSVLVPLDASLNRRVGIARVQQVVTQAAAAVLAEKARTGVFPATLPDSLTDPVNGKPLGYRCEGSNGFVVYSAGDRGSFDGGKPGTKYGKEFYFRYPPSP